MFFGIDSRSKFSCLTLPLRVMPFRFWHCVIVYIMGVPASIYQAFGGGVPELIDSGGIYAFYGLVIISLALMMPVISFICLYGIYDKYNHLYKWGFIVGLSIGIPLTFLYQYRIYIANSIVASFMLTTLLVGWLHPRRFELFPELYRGYQGPDLPNKYFSGFDK